MKPCGDANFRRSVQVGDHLAELRIALLDEEDVAVAVVHHRLADGVAAEDAGRAEAAGDSGHDREARVDLHEREVLTDAGVPAPHDLADRSERDDDRVGRVDAGRDLRDHRVPPATQWPAVPM